MRNPEKNMLELWEFWEHFACQKLLKIYPSSTFDLRAKIQASHDTRSACGHVDGDSNDRSLVVCKNIEETWHV
jgi:hypothetical protein